MVDERFSSSSFESRGLDTEQARLLADQLADEIQREMQDVLEQRLSMIVKRLNQMGHNLRLEESASGEAAYRDDYEDQKGYHCRLRVALDLVVSTGYAHLITS